MATGARKWLIGGAVAAAAAAAWWPGSPLAPWLAGYWQDARDLGAPADKGSQGKAAQGPAKNGKAAGKKGGGPAPVTVADATATDMPVILSAPGTVEPLATVGVRPRLDGTIVEVGFKEGDLVEEGQVLFRLDERLAKAQILQAEANVAKDKATLVDAQATLQRRQTLLAKNFTSEASTETAKQTVEALKASIQAGEAQLEFQRTQLDYLIIRAPISGRTGSLGAKLGAVVRTADQSPLVTINQTRPIAVAFSVPQSDLAALRRARENRSLASVTIPGSAARLSGALTFIDNQVDKQTGTITAKVTTENRDEALWPGQAVEVALTVEVKPGVISVPATAVLPSQDGMMVWVVNAQSKAAPRLVEVERIVDQTAFLAKGLKAGERVATDGQLRLAPGASVAIQQPRAKEMPAASGERRGNGRS